MSDVRCQMTDVRCQMSDVKCLTFNIKLIKNTFSSVRIYRVGIERGFTPNADVLEAAHRAMWCNRINQPMILEIYLTL